MMTPPEKDGLDKYLALHRIPWPVKADVSDAVSWYRAGMPDPALLPEEEQEARAHIRSILREGL